MVVNNVILKLLTMKWFSRNPRYRGDIKKKKKEREILKIDLLRSIVMAKENYEVLVV